MNNSYQKYERLKRKRYFDAIFSHGKSVKSFPIRAIYLSFELDNFPKSIELPSQTQVAFAVPKKRFKNAVDRNRIKRQILETYRLNKTLLTKPHAIVFVYLSNSKMSYEDIDLGMKAILNKIEASDYENTPNKKTTE